MLNFLWLEDFRVLAATGNFSRAADERHMTQPAFSRRIRALEEWLGAELFDRSTQPAKLTEVGEWFRGVADELLARVARVPGEARIVAEASSVTLRIAATHALSFTFLPLWLRGLEARTTLGPVQLVSDVLQRCEALMLQSKVQFVLSHSHAQARGALDGEAYVSVVVGHDKLVPVSAANKQGKPLHVLGGKTAKAVPVLEYAGESGLGRIVRAVVGPRLESLPVRVAFTAHLASVLRTMALDGRGVAWLPEILVKEDMAAGRLVPASDDGWNVPIEIRLYRERRALGAAAEAFWSSAK
ncbi:LysR family transcriptional regulator [Caenimonas aquaedulcis]|uniref:LysR family transcriptional regulator n=1 Tax=Caenimonas aquaedulcis TaxID=2793270 RepID=A0A931H4L0_9BURK|nr:LysR family transcriptional regulator [Caenimonas aquaedulcis]MBG9388388.1 LysR family transcriptional regulator [Caenimonas aquaedulcis]